MKINTNINTTSLDQLILTSDPFTPEIQNLLLYSAGGIDGLQLNFQQAKAGVNFTVPGAAPTVVPVLTFSPHTNIANIEAAGVLKGQFH